jgi:hypothetical protein
MERHGVPSAGASSPCPPSGASACAAGKVHRAGGSAPAQEAGDSWGAAAAAAGTSDGGRRQQTAEYPGWRQQLALQRHTLRRSRRPGMPQLPHGSRRLLVVVLQPVEGGLWQ